MDPDNRVGAINDVKACLRLAGCLFLKSGSVIVILRFLMRGGFVSHIGPSSTRFGFGYLPTDGFFARRLQGIADFARKRL